MSLMRTFSYPRELNSSAATVAIVFRVCCFLRFRSPSRAGVCAERLIFKRLFEVCEISKDRIPGAEQDRSEEQIREPKCESDRTNDQRSFRIRQDIEYPFCIPEITGVPLSANQLDSAPIDGIRLSDSIRHLGLFRIAPASIGCSKCGELESHPRQSLWVFAYASYAAIPCRDITVITQILPYGLRRASDLNSRSKLHGD